MILAYTSTPCHFKVRTFLELFTSLFQTEKRSPDFAQPLESIVATEGSTIRLECHVTGTPEPEVSLTSTARGRLFNCQKVISSKSKTGTVIF